MPANLSSFQSLVQLAAGVNLALFSLPNLRQPEIEVETRRWASLIAWSRGASEPLRRSVTRSGLSSQAEILQLEEGVRAVKPYSLGATGLVAAYLVWMSLYPEKPPDGWTWILLGSACLPPAAFAAQNIRAHKRLGASRGIRRTLERALDADSRRRSADDPEPRIA